MRTTTEPCACLASFPVSNESRLPPVNSIETSCFMVCPCEGLQVSYELRAVSFEQTQRALFEQNIGSLDCARLTAHCRVWPEKNFNLNSHTLRPAPDYIGTKRQEKQPP